MYDAILTHGGPAHFDDLLAVSLCLHAAPQAPVYRRDATDEDRADARVAVVDTGGLYDPARACFDHHHDARLPAAYVLVARHLGLEARLEAVYGWWAYRSALDCRGPAAAGAAFGVTAPAGLLQSPVEAQLLVAFGAAREIAPGEALHRVLTAFGEGLVADAADALALAAAAEARAACRVLAGLHVVGVPVPVAGPAQRLLRAALARRGVRLDVLVMPSPRGGVVVRPAPHHAHRLALHRLVPGQDGVRFVHATGFMAVFDTHAQAWAFLQRRSAATCASPAETQAGV